MLALVQLGDPVDPAVVAVMPTKVVVQERQVREIMADPVH
jgi:hypothetical protein